MTGRSLEPGSIYLDEHDHPDHPGWREWRLADPTRFNGAVLGLVLTRSEGGNRARIRLFPKHVHTNMHNEVHGGVVMALIDIAMFAGATIATGRNFGYGLTLELNTHFVGSADIIRPLDAAVEVVRETGRLVFTRGLVVQDDDVVASFNGIIRKPTGQ